jgi:diaminohydroxyphosphoribosylaminopyrimidine deaminase/5-amino-6-(5-phosphoribosylamino)uracil reductase
LADAGAEVLELAGSDGRVDLRGLLAALYDRDARVLLVEGGATLAGAFVRDRLADRVVAYTAPALLGAGPPVLADAGVGTIGAAVRLTIDDVTQFGPDVRVISSVVREGS